MGNVMPRRFPLFSVLSLLSVFVFFFGSIPIISADIDRQLQEQDTEYSKSDEEDDSAGKMAGFAMIFGVSICTALGAIVGVALAVIAHFRREPFLKFRAFTFIGNLGIVLYAIFEFRPMIMFWFRKNI
jgi:hypothetical protein